MKQIIRSYLEEPLEDWPLPVELVECVVAMIQKMPPDVAKTLAQEIVKFIQMLLCGRPPIAISTGKRTSSICLP